MISVDIANALRLYLVADPDQYAGPLLPAVEAALAGGVTMVQLRAKSVTDRKIVELGWALRNITRSRNVPLLVNDRVDLALAIGADGAHLGVTDLAPADARRIAPQGFIVGYSPEDETDRAGDAADYLGIGPVFGTVSKADAGEALGLEEFAARVQDAGKPVVGIGGIDASNARTVMDSGAAGVAVISAILRDPDPGAAARTLRSALDGGVRH